MMLTESDIFTHTQINFPYVELLFMITREVTMRKININPEFAESLTMKIV
jgi:hypothetical protein